MKKTTSICFLLLLTIFLAAFLPACSRVDKDKKHKNEEGKGKIIFISNRDDNYEIYLMDADGSNQTRLTNTQDLNESWPSVSLDGTKVLYVTINKRLSDARLFGQGQIYTMDMDGSNQKSLNISGYRPSFSPDGSKILFCDDEYVCVADVDGSNQKQLAKGKAPAYSPNGEEIAYISLASEIGQDLFMSAVGQVSIMNSDGTNQRQLTDFGKGIGRETGLNGLLSFSPNGDKVAFYCMGDMSSYSPEAGLHVIHVEDSKIEFVSVQLSKTDTAPVFSADGSTVYVCFPDPVSTDHEEFLLNGMGVYAFNADSSGQKKIASFPLMSNILQSENRFFSSFDNSSFFLCSRDENGVNQIYTVDADGENLKCLTPDAKMNVFPYYFLLTATNTA